MERAFAAFERLPAPRSCWDVLGVRRDATADEIKAAFRTKAKDAHLDAGGSAAQMAELNKARDDAMRAGAGQGEQLT